MQSYKGLELSPFQAKAIEGVQRKEHVVVSTHTGNGKTLIADYAVEQCYETGTHVIYTAPIKTLSNQKFFEFQSVYGEDVGLVTGDHTLRRDAPILVMTTEVLRNMIHEDPSVLEPVDYIVLDEIHYLSNEQRGTVWEEVMIFKPPGIKILGLSATIPNLQELCSWMESIYGESVLAVRYEERIVPQQHFYFDKQKGSLSSEKLLNHWAKQCHDNGKVLYRNHHKDFLYYAVKQQLLPVLFFVFSRKQTEQKAMELAESFSFLNEEKVSQIEALIYQYETDYPEMVQTESWKNVTAIVKTGVGYHHAGLLPVVKQFMEELFLKQLCVVLYATETFAVGINYPVRTVAFQQLRKFDGELFRFVMGSEYLQMAGRAGRRGLDDHGYVFVIADYRFLEEDGIFPIETTTSEPITSRFQLNYTAVLNWIDRLTRKAIADYLKNSFAEYQHGYQTQEIMKNLPDFPLWDDPCAFREEGLCPLEQKDIVKESKTISYALDLMEGPIERYPLEKIQSKKTARSLMPVIQCDKKQQKKCKRRYQAHQERYRDFRQQVKQIQAKEKASPFQQLLNDFEKRSQLLEELGYIKDGTLLIRGEIASRIHINPLLVTELIMDGWLLEMDPASISAVLSGIADAENESIVSLENKLVADIFQKLSWINGKELKKGIHQHQSRFSTAGFLSMERWASGAEFQEVMAQGNYSEGGFVSLVRRTIDLMDQIETVADPKTKTKIKQSKEQIDRGIASIGY